jgi:hypothetical protein
MFKVIIAGNRKFNNFELLIEKCDNILKDIEDEIQIVSGKASGADTLGEDYAKLRGYSIKEFPAPWADIEGKPESEIGVRWDGKKYWKKAGIFRNGQMAEYADALIAFHNGSSGTANMIKTADKYNLKKRVIKYV